MRILYGTTNTGKLRALCRAVEGMDLEIIGLRDLPGDPPKVTEYGRTPLENAEIKARAYYRAYGMPVVSLDSGLYFRELTEAEQPGLYVRRLDGKELSDDEIIAHYSGLAAQHGGILHGRYRNALCLILDEEHCFSSMDLSLATEPFILTSVPHPRRVPGFPLDSLSVDPATGKYYHDLGERELSTSVDAGLRAFFRSCLPELK